MKKKIGILNRFQNSFKIVLQTLYEKTVNKHKQTKREETRKGRNKLA